MKKPSVLSMIFISGKISFRPEKVLLNKYKIIISASFRSQVLSYSKKPRLSVTKKNL